MANYRRELRTETNIRKKKKVKKVMKFIKRIKRVQNEVRTMLKKA